MTKIIKFISQSAIIALFSPNIVFAGVVGTANLYLNGILDMTLDTREEHEVTGALTGDNSFRVEPIYSAKNLSYWTETNPFIGISNSQTNCTSTGFEVRPGTFTFRAIPLTNNSGIGGKAFILPAINFEILTEKNNRFLPYYAGTFFATPPEGLTVSASQVSNSCYIPTKSYLDVPAGGIKTINISSPNKYTIYVDKDISPGDFSYANTTAPLYIMTGGSAAASRAALRLNISAKLTVLRYCEVSSVTNTKIEHQFANEMENIQNSSLTVRCNGSRLDTLNMVALAKETTYDANEPTKLLLQPTDNAIKTDTLPWVLGRIFPEGTSSSLKCSDVGRDDLIHFDGREKDLGIRIEPNKPMILNIKWALCRTPEVKPGNYHGKTELSFFVKS